MKTELLLRYHLNKGKLKCGQFYNLGVITVIITYQVRKF